jgi:hypothetical protein
MFDRSDFANGLAAAISKHGDDHKALAKWAFETRANNIRSLDHQVEEWLTRLGAMDIGPQFECSADDLQALIAEASR